MPRAGAHYEPDAMERNHRNKESAPTDAEGLRAFLVAREGSALRAWLRHFDRDNDKRARKHEFYCGLAALGYTGDIASLFAALDQDHSGELGLDEIDDDQAALWERFCEWCVATFDGAADMVRRVAGMPVDGLTFELFKKGLQNLGWTEGREQLLFSALDVDDNQRVGPGKMRWLDLEKRRLHRKQEAKKRSAKDNAKRIERRKKARILVQEFRNFLLHRYGDYLRAWRVALNPSGSLTLRKTQFLKACARLGWQASAHLIWETLDKDDSGSISLDELDLKTVELLASFHAFVMERFGSASAAFRGIDESNTRQVRLPDFTRALQKLGFSRKPRQLFNGLDRDGSRVLTEDEFLFLDQWKPQPYLLANPNPQAANEFKALVLDRYNNYLKAWRHLIDQDSTNRCNWDEFQEACSALRFSGDSAGAWRALDADLSGYITLQEIDADSCSSLIEFRTWADNEFGGVKSAFQVFDIDGSNQVTKHEFCRSCRVYGYVGDANRLFHALDVDREGTLCNEEVAFLDEWEIDLPEEHASESEELKPQRRNSTLGRRMSQLLLQTPLVPHFPGATYHEQQQQQHPPQHGSQLSHHHAPVPLQALQEEQSQSRKSSLILQEDSYPSVSRVLSGSDVEVDYSVAPSMRLLAQPARRTPQTPRTPRRQTAVAEAGSRALPPISSLSLEDVLDFGLPEELKVKPGAEAEGLGKAGLASTSTSSIAPPIGSSPPHALDFLLGLTREKAKQPQDAAVRAARLRLPARGNYVSVERAMATYAVPGMSLSARGGSASPPSSKRAGADASLFLFTW